MPDFDETLPSGSKNIRLGDDDLRLNAEALVDRLEKEHYFPDNATVSRQGRHKFGVGSGAARTAAIPAPASGNVWYNTGTQQWTVYDGAGWRPIGHRVGDIKLYAAAIPNDHDGWIICDGREIDDTSKLAAVISNFFDDNGVDPLPGAGKVRVPRLKGRVPVGWDAVDPDFQTMGFYGGEKTHLLSVAEMPAHTHPGSTALVDGGGITNVMQSGGSGNDWGTGGQPFNLINMSHTHALSIASQGGGGAHNNVQPFLVLTYYIFAGF